jgi:geranylgeranyl diphosphate synthase type I
MIDDVMIGQLLDVDIMTRHRTDIRRIDEKMRLKTASYTFVRPMQIGAALAGTDARTDRFCEDFGTAVGMAFQIQDDLLDVTARSRTLKKTVFSDLRDHQHTVLTQYVFDHGAPAHRRKLRTYFGSPVPESERQHVRDLFTSSGAIAFAQRRIDACFSRAMRTLRSASLRAETERDLSELLAYLRHRQS